MFQFGKYNLDIIEMLSGHQAHQFKGLGLDRQLQHPQQVQLHQHQLQQQQQAESSGALLSGLGLGPLQGPRGNAFSDSASIFAKMSAPPPPPLQQQPSSSQSSRSKQNKMSSSSSHSSGYPQFLRSFHPSEAALAQDQLHPSVGRFEHFTGGSGSSGSVGGLGGLVSSAPPPPPLHSGLSVPQASPGPPSSPAPSTSVSTSNNPSSSSAVSSLGHQLVGAQSDARSLHQQFSCMLAANQYFLSGVPANASLEQFLGTHNHLGIGLSQAGGENGSSLGPPPVLHNSHAHGHPTSQPQQTPQQQQLPPHTLSHTHVHSHPHHSLHPGSQPSSLSGFDFQGIPVLSSNQIASLMQQESGLPLPLPLHLSLSKDDCKGESNSVGSNSNSSSRRKKAMAGYLPQRKADSTSNGSSHGHNSHSNLSNGGGLSHGQPPALIGNGVGLSNIGGDPSSLIASSSSSSSLVSSSSSSVPSSATASALISDPHISKCDNPSSMQSNPSNSDSEPMYSCSDCGKSFPHLSSLRRHLRMHEPTTAGTSSSVSVRPNPIHIKTEPDPNLPHSTQEAPQPSSHSCPSPDKVFHCPECGKGFKKKGHLLQHGVIHSAARPFGCSTCSRAFNRRESLTRHEKIHEEKPFRCPACGRAFRESTSLLNHAASGTCGKPGRGPKQRSGKIETDGEDRGGGVGNGGGGTYQSNRGGIYGKTEEEEGIIIVGEGEPKSGLGCDGLYQSGRGGNSNDRDRTDGKYPTDYSRNRYTGYHDDHRSQSNPSPCYSGASPCGSGMAGLALRKAPLAPTLHPHSQTHPHHHHPQQQQHLPLSSLLDDTEDDVTSSVNSAISAITAANSGGPRGDERGDIIGGLLGGLGLGPLGSPSSTMDKTYRSVGEQEAMSSTQDPCAKPKRPRKPRAKKEPTVNEDPSKRRQYTQRMSTSGLPRTHLCSVCGKGFARRETLRRHDRIHTGEKPHHCTVCGKYFREAFHLSKHQTVHSGAKNYKCTICGKEFGYSQSLRRHGKLHQKGENEEVPATPVTTENLNSFNPNPQCSMVQDRSQNQVPSTSSYYSYSQDVKPQDTNPSSHPPRLYTCAICWKSFRHHFHLTAHHQTVHDGGGEKVFSCEVCGKSFAYSNSLTRHKQSQHGITRTETSNTHESNSRPANNQSASEVNQSTSESEAATNALLQMTPSTEAHVGPGLPVVSHSHPQPPSHAPGGYSPLFYDTIASSNAPTFSQPLPPNSTLMPPQHPHSPAGVKGEHIYPAGSRSRALHTTAPFQPLTELPSTEHHHLHHHLHQSHLHPHHLSDTQAQQQADCSIDLSQDNIGRHKKRKKKSNRQDWRETKWDCQDTVKYGAKRKNKKTFFSVSGQYNKKQAPHRKTVRSVRGYKLINSGEFKTLSSLKVPVKRFGCPLCPSSVFSRRAGLLVHMAAKHTQKALSSQERLSCRVCGKQSDGPFAAFVHRAVHYSRGTFSCRDCRLHFWNATLLHRHKECCRRRAKGLHKGKAKKLKQAERPPETETQPGDVQDKMSFL